MYDVGEDRKEVIKRIWKCENELDFMLDTQEVNCLLPSLLSFTAGTAVLGYTLCVYSLQIY
jgi:hypothetical protein